MKRSQRTLGVVLAIAVAAGCSEGNGNPSTPDGDLPNPPDAGADAGQPDSAVPRVLTAISATPENVSLLVGNTESIGVTGTYDDGSTGAVEGATFASGSDAVATVDSTGLVTGAGGGTTTITVSAGGFTDTVAVDVTAGVVFDVFKDNYGADLSYAPFGGSTGQPFVDSTTAHTGTSSLAITVPASGYTGGAIVLAAGKDLSGYTALTFWAKASIPVKLNEVGLGNDSAGTTYQAKWNAVDVSTTWQRYVLPLPLPAKLTAEKGLFHFAEGAEEGTYTLWIDDIRYESEPNGGLGTLTPAIATETASKLVGDSFTVGGTSLAWDAGGTAKVLSLTPAYFTFTSSDPLVATVDAAGVVTAIGVGTTEITAKLGALDANGKLTLTVAPSTAPDTGPTAPTVPATDVIALFSDAYTAVTVNTWRAPWSDATLTETTLGTDAVKKYSNLKFVGIEFTGASSIDATTMTHFHVDVWTPDATELTVRLVDFGPNNSYDGGGDDVEDDVKFDAASTPVLLKGEWQSLDIPLASFEKLTAPAHLSQLLFISSNATVYVDNVYFHK